MTNSTIVSITDELIAELEQEARNATPGPLTADASPVGELYVSGACDEFICGAVDHVHDANLIALANPATILALLAERAELKKDARRALNIEAAARKLAECMDYPWEYMPAQGRDSMRKHAQAVIAAAMQEPKP